MLIEKFKESLQFEISVKFEKDLGFKQ